MDVMQADLDLALESLRNRQSHDYDFWSQKAAARGEVPIRQWINHYMLGICLISQYLDYEKALEAFEHARSTTHNADAAMHIMREKARVLMIRPGKHTEEALLHIDRAIALVPSGDFSMLGYCYGMRAAIVAKSTHASQRKGAHHVGHFIGEYGRAVSLTRAGENRALELEVLLSFIKQLVLAEQFELAYAHIPRAFDLMLLVGTDDEQKEFMELSIKASRGQRLLATTPSRN